MVDRAHSVLLWSREHALLSVDDLARAAALQPKRVETFVGFGLIEPTVSTGSGPLFPRSSVERLRRIVRLRRDLGINLAGIAAVLDMRERIESLQREVERLRGRLQSVE
jgi:MerR family transcriptional regulator/heat shock protein HspR